VTRAKEKTMATKSTRKKTKAPGHKTASARERLRKAWDKTLEALTSAEQEVQRQIKTLVKQNRLHAGDARDVLKTLGDRVQPARKRALREIESGLKAFQARARKERKALGRVVDEAVQGALATFNIPSRHEVAQLTRKVEELSRKIDGFRRRPARRSAA
jgi:poly(hydroxyalkanoate) granule-associated protein